MKELCPSLCFSPPKHKTEHRRAPVNGWGSVSSAVVLGVLHNTQVIYTLNQAISAMSHKNQTSVLLEIISY